MELDFDVNEFINAREQGIPRKRLEPPVDMVVTKIVGKKVLAQDPRLINLVVKWKKQKNDDEQPDNFLQDAKKVEELKRVFGV